MTSDVLTRPLNADAAQVGGQLQATLLELIELSLQAKQAHWNVTGPLFRSVHQELDEIVDTARWAADEVAERMATVGRAPDGRSGTIVEAGTFSVFPQGNVSTEQAIGHIGGLLDELTGRLRERLSGFEGDLVSQGIMINISERLEKHAWMLRAQRS